MEQHTLGRPSDSAAEYFRLRTSDSVLLLCPSHFLDYNAAFGVSLQSLHRDLLRGDAELSPLSNSAVDPWLCGPVLRTLSSSGSLVKCNARGINPNVTHAAKMADYEILPKGICRPSLANGGNPGGGVYLYRTTFSTWCIRIRCLFPSTLVETLPHWPESTHPRRSREGRL